MPKIDLLSAVTAANGPPVATRGVATITTVAAANIVDGEYFTISFPLRGLWRFTFDKDGVWTPTVVQERKVDLVGAVTDTDVRDRIVAAITPLFAGEAVAAAATANTLTVTLANPSPWTGPNAEAVANATFAITDFIGGAISGVALRAGAERGAINLGDIDEWYALIYSVAGSGTMDVTVKFWAYSIESDRWAPIGNGTGVHATAATKGVLNGGNAIGETGNDVIDHGEPIRGLIHFDRVYPEVVTINGTSTAISMQLVARKPVIRA